MNRETVTEKKRTEKMSELDELNSYLKASVPG